MSAEKRVEEILDILKSRYLIQHFVPKTISGPLCISAFDNTMDMVVSMPGHVDDHKWVLRVWPKTMHNGVYNDLGKFLEKRFDSPEELVIYLTEYRADIYRQLYEFVLKKYTTEVLK